MPGTVRLFSAHAEVFPARGISSSVTVSLLRTRGGISIGWKPTDGTITSSPHTRRYFRVAFRRDPLEWLFSAHAEVFPSIAWLVNATPPLLRTRGGISIVDKSGWWEQTSSPHTRRYFRDCGAYLAPESLFSAHAEVVLRYQASSSPPTLWPQPQPPIASAAPASGSTPRTRAAPARAPSTRPTTGGSAGKRPAVRSHQPPPQRAPTSTLHRNRP